MSVARGKIDTKTVERYFGGFKAALPQALARVVNRIASKVRTEASRRIRSKVALPASYVRERLFLRPATASKLEAVIYAKRRGVLVSRFKWRQLWEKNLTKSGRKAAGITGMIVPGRSYTARRWFVIPMLKDSHVPGIAIRNSRARKDIEVLHGPSVSQVFN